MKKILNILFIGLISILFLPFNVNAKSMATLDVNSNNNKITVEGTTENGVLAIAVLVYNQDELIHMETCSNNNNKYSCELSKTFEEGNYTVKVADYDGGDYITKNVSVIQKNPETSDYITFTILLSITSLIGILVITLKNKKLV